MKDLTGRAEELLDELSAIEPVYHQNYGDACYLHLRSGARVLDKRSIRGVKQALVRLKALDQISLRRLCGEELDRQLNLPLPLSKNLILVPLKMRQPVTGNDCAYGLVNLVSVRKVVSGADGGSLIILDSGYSLKVMASRDISFAHLGEGTLLRRHFVTDIWGM